MLNTINATITFDTYAFAVKHPCIWSKCSGFSTQVNNYLVDCCILQVPLNYAQPNKTMISIFMLRCRPPNITANNTLFILTGGPGESGVSRVKSFTQLIPVTYGITLIFPDHRGTGYSSLLSCDDKNSQVITSNCISYLIKRWTIEGLNQFSVTAAAHDVSIQIQSSQSIGRVAILAYSYGTLWLDRLLQIYPNLVQAAVMDSPMNPLLSAQSLYNIRGSSVAWQFLSYCTIQNECNRYFPNDLPGVLLYKILRDLDLKNQTCINKYFSQYNITSTEIRSIFFGLIQLSVGYFVRNVIPAVIFRLNRCNKDDVIVLNYFFRGNGLLSYFSNITITNNNDSEIQFSSILYFNIVHSELWLTADQSKINDTLLYDSENFTIMSPGYPEDMMFSSAWPKYPLDEYRFRVANSQVLMIAGQLDPATPFDLATHLASITGKTRTFYSIPLAGHLLVYMASIGYLCPLQLMLAWTFPALFPSNWSNPACIQDMPTVIDFVGATKMGQEASLKLLNVTKPFGNNI